MELREVLPLGTGHNRRHTTGVHDGHHAHSSENTTSFLVVPEMEPQLSREDLQITWVLLGLFWMFSLVCAV